VGKLHHGLRRENSQAGVLGRRDVWPESEAQIGSAFPPNPAQRPVTPAERVSWGCQKSILARARDKKKSRWGGWDAKAKRKNRGGSGLSPSSEKYRFGSIVVAWPPTANCILLYKQLLSLEPRKKGRKSADPALRLLIWLL